MFTDADIAAGGHVAVLGEGFWRERLGGDTGALGKAITVGESTYTILGVLPARLRFGPSSGHPTDVWIPFDLANRNGGGSVLGRLRPGVDNGAAQRELDSISARSGGFRGSSIPFVAVVQSPAQRVKFRDSLELLAAAVGLLLVVACVNVAHLLLARSAARQREIAIRTALGADVTRLFRQLLTESALLTGAATALGLCIGWSALRVLVTLRPASHDELTAARLDATTVGIAVVVAVACGMGFGVISAIHASRQSAHDALKSGSLGAGIARAHRRTRAILVVSEIALSGMLVVGTGLVVRSLERLQHTDLGFNPKNLYTLYLTYGSKLADSTSRVAALRAVETRLGALPGITSMTVADVGPGSRWFSVGRFEIDGEAPPGPGATSFNDVNHVQPNYFRTMGIDFVEGGPFSDTSAHAVIVNEGFARKHWPRRNALGNRIRIAEKGDEPWLTIVGVVHDALTSGPSAESTAPSLYLPPVPGADRNILVRATGGARSLVGVRKIAREAGIREVTIESVQNVVSRSISEPRFVTAVLSSFSVVALLLSSIGLYGLMAYTVAQEARETGIRVALGASRGHIIRHVLVRGATLAVAGAIIGLGAAVWGTKMIENRLYGVARLDTVSFGAGAVVLITAALVACIVPTRRALMVDPVSAIRAD
jgi:putative ABC transport system permease protein